MKSRLLILALAFTSTVSGCGGEGGGGGGPDPIVTPIPIPPGPDPEPSPSPGEGWLAQESNAESALTTLSASDPGHAWAAGWMPGVRRTQDGGSTWSAMGLDGSGVKKIQFLDDQNGWAVTGYSVLSTSDGGQTWVTRKTATQNPFSSLSFVSPTVGYVAAQTYELFRTTDGGLTWTFLPVLPPMNGVNRALRAVKFVNSQTGWVAAGHHVSGECILKTDDGGMTWSEQYVISTESAVLTDIEAVDATHAWACGSMDEGDEGEILLGTTNGGATWNAQSSDGSSGIRAVHFVSATIGWAVGRKIHYTANGGATWSVQSAPAEQFFDVFFVNAQSGWVVGLQGLILKTDSGGN